MDGVNVRTVAQLGAVVRRLRVDRDWSQQQLAEVAGVSRVFISQLENGKARAEVRLVLAVLQALGGSIQVTPDGNLDDTGDLDGEPDLLGDQPW